MMAGNPSSWWSMHNPPISQQSSSQYHNNVLHGSSSSSSSQQQQLLPLNSLADHQHPHHLNQEPLQLPHSWSQLLMGGLGGEEDRRLFASLQFHDHYQHKNRENWDQEDHHQEQSSSRNIAAALVDVIKQEGTPQTSSNHRHLFGHLHHGNNNNNNIGGGSEEFQTSNPGATWSQQQIMGVSSPRSCVTSLSSNILDFSFSEADRKHNNNNNNNIQQQHPDHSSYECNSTEATGGVCKKARVHHQPSSSQPPLKVRKEKLGDRITALHQLVSPFGKTDTASVLLEAIGYIRFLQGQIEALSSPYLGSPSSNMRNNQQFLLNDNCLKRKGGPNQDDEEKPIKDLRSRGLCLVPVSCTQQVASDNGADYWAPGGF